MATSKRSTKKIVTRKPAKRKGPKRDKIFKLSAKQKRNLPTGLQKAILKYHRGK